MARQDQRQGTMFFHPGKDDRRRGQVSDWSNEDLLPSRHARRSRVDANETIERAGHVGAEECEEEARVQEVPGPPKKDDPDSIVVEGCSRPEVRRAIEKGDCGDQDPKGGTRLDGKEAIHRGPTSRRQDPIW